MHASRVRPPAVSVSLAGLVLLGAIGPPRAATGAKASPVSSSIVYVIRIDDEATAGTVRRLLDGVRERLAEPRCQKVLDAFSGQDGSSLRERLEAIGHSPESYLGLIVFYDGRRHPRCEQRGVLAVTQVGSRVVYVCPEALYQRARRYPLWAEATLIHEVLHTLGLGENPPSSREITSTVIRHCRH